MRKLLILVLVVLIGATAAFAQSAMPAAGGKLTVGLLMVGPYNDHGWSQAHYDGMQYVTAKVPGVDFV